jgi:uncharacterized protein
MTINTPQLYNAFISGAQTLIAQRQSLNAINVFPVADGDTGTNMASTVEAILRHGQLKDNMADTLASITDAVSMNAKGNSGAIFAQFVIGLNETLPDRELSENDMITALNEAVKRVYSALSHPVEGTMITVMRLWVNELEHLITKGHDLKEAFDKALLKANEVLKDTPNLLTILKEHHVVDSGAKGFVHFLEGFSQGLFSKTKPVITLDDSLRFEEGHIVDANEVITHRYCTEALVEGEIGDIKEQLDALGDSVLIVKSHRFTKIHLHTNTPDQVMALLETKGKLIQQKADDMVLQHADFSPKAKIALVTDSIADIPASLILDHQIHVMPLTILVDGAPYLDRLTLPASRFYDKVNTFNEYPSSSQPNQKAVEAIFKDLLTHYSQVLAVTVSSGMSGTHQVVKAAAEAFKGKVAVVDSKKNSGAQGLLVLQAADLIRQGQALDSIVNQLEQSIPLTHIFVSVDTLKYMVKMGRISPVVGRIAKWVNLKPIVSIDANGKGVTMGSAFSKAQTEAKILKQLDTLLNNNDLVSYVIVHGNDPTRATRFTQLLTERLGQAPAFVEEVSTIVAMSAGPKTIAVALQLKPKPQA